MICEYGTLVEWYWQGKTDELGEKPSQCHFIHHKSHMDWPGRELGSPSDDICLWSPGGMVLTEENRRTRRKTFPGPLCSPQIRHGLNRTRTRVSLRWHMFMEPRWNDTDRGNRRNRRKIFPSATAHHKSHIDWPGCETGSPQWEAGDLPTRARHGLAWRGIS
jgi:hypothetical protein